MRTRDQKLMALATVSFLFLMPLLAWAAQEVLMTGVDSNGIVRRVKVDASGQLGSSATHGACTNTTMNVGTSATVCPPSQLATRSSILWELQQSGETLTVVTDGTNTASATLGIGLSSGQTYADNLVGTVAPSCRCTAATCSVRVVECP